MVGLTLGLLFQLHAGVQPGVRVETRVRPETVLVGKPFTAMVRVRAPRGTVVQFPVPEPGADVDTVGRPERRDSVVGDDVEAVMTYRLAAWRTGVLSLALGGVTLDTPEGTVTDSLHDAKVVVRSVLPADTAKHIPRAPRPAFAPPIGVRVRALLGRLALVLLALLVTMLLGSVGVVWWRRRRLAATREVPLEWAEREFRRVEAMRLVEVGDPERHAILMAEVVRQYIVRRYPAVRASATTTELTSVLRAVVGTGVGTSTTERLAERVIRLFTGVDMLKFARAPMTAAEATTAGMESRAIVRALTDHGASGIEHGHGSGTPSSARREALGRAA